MKQRPSTEKQKPTFCASGSILPNSAPCGKPANTANITHAANAANITLPANIENIPNISRAANNANIAHITNAANNRPAANIPNISRFSNNANIAHITNAANFTPAANKACCSFAPGFSCSFAHFGSSCPRKSPVSHIVPHPWQLIFETSLSSFERKAKRNCYPL